MVKLTSWVGPKDTPLRMRPLALHIGPDGDVLRTSGHFLGRPQNVLRTLFCRVGETSKKKYVMCQDKNQLKFCCKSWWQEQSFIFSLVDHEL